MVEAGLVEEMASLLAAGYSPDLPALSSLGYREIAAHLRGEISLQAAVERIQIETHRFVRHQYTWFRRISDIHWFDVSEAPQPAIRKLTEDFLHRNNKHGVGPTL